MVLKACPKQPRHAMIISKGDDVAGWYKIERHAPGAFKIPASPMTAAQAVACCDQLRSAGEQFIVREARSNRPVVEDDLRRLLQK